MANLQRYHAEISRGLFQPWGINLQRVNNQYVVQSIQNNDILNAPNSLKKDDIIDTVNGVPLATIPATGLKGFFDAITTASIYYFRKGQSQPEIIDLLDDDDDDPAMFSGENESIDKDEEEEEDEDLFDSDEPQEEVAEAEEEINSELNSDYDFDALIHHINRPYQYQNQNQNQNRSTGRVTRDPNYGVVIDLISDDEAPPPPRPAPPQPPARRSSQAPTQSSSRPSIQPNQTPTPAVSRTPSAAPAPATVRATAPPSAPKAPVPASQSAEKPRTHIGNIKIKLEFEPKKFGEADIGDEVVEVPPPSAATENDNPASAVKRSFGNAFGDGDGDDDEIEFVGGNMQVAADMPHQREACPRFPFQRMKEVPQNRSYCPNCFCFICEVKATECLEWNTHCHAHCKDPKWKRLRDSSNAPILRLMAPSDKAQFLARYKSALNASNSSGSSHMYGYSGYDSYDDDDYDDEDDYPYYGGYNGRNVHSGNDESNAAMKLSTEGIRAILDKNTITSSEFMECTALILNIIRLATFSRIETIINLVIEWMLTPNFNAQFYDLLKQQISKIESSYSRLSWLTKAGEIFLKLSTSPGSFSNIPNEFYEINDKSFIKLLRKTIKTQSMPTLRVIMDKKFNENFISEYILEYFRSQDKDLYPLLIEYLPRTMYLTNFKQTLKSKFETFQFMKARPLLSLICELIDSKRSNKMFLADDGIMHAFFSLLLQILMDKISIDQIPGLIDKITSHSAISVLLENRNLQLRNWAENRFQTLVPTTNSSSSSSSSDANLMTPENIDLEEMSMVIMIILIFFTEYCRKIQPPQNLLINELLTNMTAVESTVVAVLPTHNPKSAVFMANVCCCWSLNKLMNEHIYFQETFFHFSCFFAKYYFNFDISKLSVKDIKLFHPLILNELSRISFLEFKNQAVDLSMVNQYHIHLHNRLDASSGNTLGYPTLSQLTSTTSIHDLTSSSQQNLSELIPSNTLAITEESKLVVEYPNHTMLMKEIFQPTNSLISREQSLKILGHRIDSKNVLNLYYLLNSLYYSNENSNNNNNNNNKSKVFNDFIHENFILLKLIFKSYIFHFWSIQICQNDSLKRLIPSRGNTKNFLEEFTNTEIFTKITNLEELLPVVVLRMIFKTLRNIESKDEFSYNQSLAREQDINLSRDSLIFCKKMCFEIQSLVQSTYIPQLNSLLINAGKKETSLEKEFCKLFFLIYPLLPTNASSSSSSLSSSSFVMDNILWDCFFKTILSQHFTMDGNTSIFSRLFFEKYERYESLSAEVYLLAFITVDDLFWKKEEISMKLQQLYDSAIGNELTRTFLCVRAAIYPNSILANLYPYCSDVQLETILGNRELIGYKVLGLYDNLSAISIPSSHQLTNKLSILQRMKITILAEANSKKVLYRLKHQQIINLFIGALFLGCFQEARLLYPLVESELVSVDNYALFSVYKCERMKYEEDFHYVFYQLIFMNINEKYLNDAISLLFSLQRGGTSSSSAASSSAAPPSLTKLQKFFLDRPNDVIWKPIMKRLENILKNHAILPISEKTWIAELFFYYSYDEQSFLLFVQALTAKYGGPESVNYQERMNSILFWLNTMKTHEPRKRIQPAADSSKNPKIKKKDLDKKRFKPFRHYSIVYYLHTNKQDFFLEIVNGFQQEKQNISHLLRNDYRYAYAFIQPIPHLYHQAERLLYALLLKSKDIYAISTLSSSSTALGTSSEISRVNDVIPFYFNSFLFLKSLTFPSKLLLMNSFNDCFFQDIVKPTQAAPERKEEENFYQFALQFLFIYKKILSTLQKSISKINPPSTATATDGKNPAASNASSSNQQANTSSSEPMVVALDDDEEDDEDDGAEPLNSSAVSSSNNNNKNMKNNSSNDDAMEVVDDEQKPSSTSNNNNDNNSTMLEDLLLAELEELFQELKFYYPISYGKYQEEIFSCLLFSQFPYFTFQLLLNHRVFPLIPIYLQQLEGKYEKGLKLESNGNISKILSTLPILLNALEYQYFLPESLFYQAISSKFFSNSSNSNATSSLDPYQIPANVYAKEFTENPNNLLISLFSYFQELQFHYLYENEQNYVNQLPANELHSNLNRFRSQPAWISYDTLVKKLKQEITHFTNKILEIVKKDPLISTFLKCYRDFFNGCKPFLESYFVYLKAHPLNDPSLIQTTTNTTSTSSTSSSMVLQKDLLLTKMLILSRKRISFFTMFQYIELMIDLYANCQLTSQQFYFLKNRVELFHLETNFHYFMNNLISYSLLLSFNFSTTSIHQMTSNPLITTETLLLRGFLSFKHTNDVLVENIAGKFSKLLSLKLPVVTKTSSSSIPFIVHPTVPALIKGFFIYLIGYIPDELKSFHNFYFMEPNFASSSTPHPPGATTSSTSIGKPSSSSSSATAGGLMIPASSSFDDFDPQQSSSSDALMNYDSFINEAKLLDYSREEKIYCADLEKYPNLILPVEDPSKMNREKRIVGTLPQSLLESIISARKQQQPAYGATRRFSTMAEQPIIKVFLNFLTQYSSSGSSSSSSSQQKGKKDQQYYLPILNLIEKFEIDSFLTCLQEYYQHEEELMIYIEVFLFILLQRELKSKNIPASSIITLYIYCQRNKYDINAKNNTKLYPNNSTSSSSWFPRDQIQKIFQLNCSKIFNYFYFCYHLTLDRELSNLQSIQGIFHMNVLLFNASFIEMIFYVHIKDAWTSIISDPNNPYSLSHAVPQINSLLSRKLLFIQIASQLKKFTPQELHNLPISINEICTYYLNLLDILVIYCRNNTMNARNKTIVADTVNFLRICYQDLLTVNPGWKGNYQTKKQTAITALKSKKTVTVILETL